MKHICFVFRDSVILYTKYSPLKAYIEKYSSILRIQKVENKKKYFIIYAFTFFSWACKRKNTSGSNKAFDVNFP